MVLESDENHEDFSGNIIEAQVEANKLVDEIEASAIESNDESDGNEALAPMPKLLQLSQEKLLEKTNDLKAKGNQLDLLLLKAESYSHFIKQNQDRFRTTLLERQKEAESMNSPSKVKAGAVSNKSLMKDSEYLQPSNLEGGKLMPHQLEALQWLLSLWENGLSGILADEMGLGKTIEVIALISQLKLSNASGPFMVIGPLATITNWLKEFKKWLPSCDVLLYHGTKQEREEMRKNRFNISNRDTAKCTGLGDTKFPVIITSFEICMIDRPYLMHYDWKFMVLDEGHRIKNRNCRLVQELKAIPCVTRLLLTGTPIQNTLEELWSLLNFVNPTIFDDLELFQSWFGFKNIGKDTKVEDIIGTEKHERVVSKLHEILRPFLLRRLKKDVFGENVLPPKKEIVIYCAMSSLQKQYYDLVGSNKLREALLSMNIEGAKDMSELNSLMQYRKVCNHPFLFGEPLDAHTGQYLGVAHPELLIAASGKFKVLDRMLASLKAGNHKVLIFSQMTKLMDIIQDFCISKDYAVCRLDGSTKLLERQAAIDAYNESKSCEEQFVFLLSTRAGGLGINLAAADTVILFDSDWNPQQDLQAQDRAHRLGQKKEVVVYRLLTTNSVEIMMMERQISKKKLERLTIQGGDFRKAGERSQDTQLSLNKLRNLLEDDVKDLNIKRGSGKLTGINFAGTGACDNEDITKEELDMIMDRERLFRTIAVENAFQDESNSSMTSSPAIISKGNGSSKKRKRDDERIEKISDLIPTEGRMYDIISMDQFTMQSVS